MARQRDIAAISRRAAIGAMAAGGAAFALFGPRGRSETPRGRVVLDYWEKWTRHEGDAMVAIVDAFNRSQGRVFVRYQVVSDIGQKSLVAIAGNRPPDLIGLYAFNVPAYAESGAILPLDDMAARVGMSLEQYAPGVRRVMVHGVPRGESGRQGEGESGRGDQPASFSPSPPLPLSPSGSRWYACVNTAGSVALYYNRALFREVGLGPDSPPRTIRELDEAHARLTKVDAGGRLERAGFLHREPGWWSWIWGYSFGASIYDQAGERATLATPENTRGYEWMQTYARELGVERVTKFAEGFGNYFTPENPFLTGKVAMIVQGPWIANLINAFKPDLDYGVAPFPVAEGLYDAAAPIGAIDTDVLVIPRGARHPEAAMEFIAFTQRRDNTEALARAHCKPSPLIDVSEEFVARHPNRGISVHYDLFKSPRAFVPPRTRVWQQFKDEFDSVVQRMWRLELPASEALGRAQPRIQSLIDAARGARRRRYG